MSDENAAGPPTMSVRTGRRYCGFVDLVGTKNLATQDSDSYWDALDRFQTKLAELSWRLDGGQIYFFSDCAFFDHPRKTAFLDFFRNLRGELLREQLYFKGSIRRGSLNASPANEHFAVDDKEESAVRARTLSGHYFGADAARLYSAQEQLKGIGTAIDKDLAQDTLSDDATPSCYLPAINSDIAQVYWDVSLTADELAPGNLQGLLRTFFDAKTRSRKLGRFYVSLLVLWVQSMDLENLTIRRSNDDDLVNLIVSGRFEKLFGDVHGITAVYLALLNRVFTDGDRMPADVSRSVRRFAESRRRMFRGLEYFPSELFGDAARRASLQALSTSVIQTSPELKRLVAAVGELRDRGYGYEEIARELRDRKIDKINGRKITASTIEGFCVRENIS